MPILILFAAVMTIWGIFVLRGYLKNRDHTNTLNETEKAEQVELDQQSKRANLRLGYVIIALVIGILLLTISGRLPGLWGIISGIATIGFKLLLNNKRLLMSLGVGLITFLFRRSKQTDQQLPPQPNKGSSTNDEQTLGRHISSPVIRLLLPKHLDENSTLDGQVHQGELKSRALSSLTKTDFVSLFKQCQQNDKFSTELLSYYLNSRFNEEWQQDCDLNITPVEYPLTLQAAYAVFGVDPSTSADDLSLAYKRLQQTFHPDRGGNSYIAAQINQAYELINTAKN